MSAGPRVLRSALARRLLSVTCALSGWALVVTALDAETTLSVPTAPGSNITIKVSSPALAVPRFGFLPVRLHVENLTTRDGTWTFRFEAGTRGVFPGIATTSVDFTVPSPEAREIWVFIPMAEPGAIIGPLQMRQVLPSRMTGPPTIDGVYPRSPPGVSPPRVSRTRMNSLSGNTEAFVITQTGPANLLPAVPLGKLPPRAFSALSTPDSVGYVTRTTTVPIDTPISGTLSFVAGGGGGRGGAGTWYTGTTTISGATSVRTQLGASSAQPVAAAGSSTAGATRTAMLNARTKLTNANLFDGRSGLSSSATTRPGKIPNILEVVVTLRQTGPATALPVLPASSLPPGFTGVTVVPGGQTGTVVREFTYVEEMPSSSNAPPFNATLAPFGAPPMDDATARRILQPTGLLKTPPTVTVGSGSYSTLAPGAGGVRNALVYFTQVGPPRDLPVPPAASLPDGVMVTLHAGAHLNEVTRVITVVDPAALAALRNAASLTGGSSESDRMVLAQVELQQRGYLRPLRGVQVGPSRRTSTAGRGVVQVFTETGPASLLPAVPTAKLPPNVFSTTATGAVAGEVQRNFIVDLAPPTPAMRAAQSLTAARRTVAVGPSSSPINVSTPLVIEVTGPGAERSRVTFPSINPSPMAPSAISTRLEAMARARLVSSGLRSVPNFAPIDAALLPADWRVWSSFNTVVLTTDDYTALDPARRAALRTWAALGGVVHLFPDAEGQGTVEFIGAGRIETLAVPLADVPTPELIVTLALSELSAALPNRDRLQLEPGSPLGKFARFEGAEILWLTLFLITFAIVIGPVNLFIFAPAGKRHRLFFTTPVISLLGAAAVSGAIILQDGFGGEGARRALVVLVPGENQAAVFQEQAARTGFLLRRTFDLDDATLCAILPIDAVRAADATIPPQFVRERKEADGDWFRNRSHQAHLLRQVVPTRARIQWAGTAGGAPVIESTFATELKDFRYRDADGNRWQAERVGPGRRVTLQPDRSGVLTIPAVDDFLVNGTENLAHLTEAVMLRAPGQWCAEGGATDLAPIATLASIRWRDEAVVYAGHVEGAPAPTPAPVIAADPATADPEAPAPARN